MKKVGILFILVSLCIAADVSKQALPFEGHLPFKTQKQPEPCFNRNFIAAVGDVRTVMGPQSMNIAVAEDGQTIAVVYGPPSDPYDPNQAFQGVHVAYSTDMGQTWALYGPFSLVSPLRRIYPGVDGITNFHTEPGGVFFVWQEGQSGYDPTLQYTMIEENIPSSPSFSSPVLLAPDAYDIDGWMQCIGVNPEDPYNVMVSAWSYLNNGNLANYCWVSDDGGYTWSDTIAMTPAISSPPCYNGAGHFRWGSNDYVFFTYHDTLGSAPQYPHYVESTDGGFNWSAPATLPAISQVQFWWHELTCEVINDLPFAVHNDLDAAGILQSFFPDPDDPGSIGSWNWTTLNVSGLFDGAHAYQGTTWTLTHIQYPSICYGTVATDSDPLELILITFKAGYAIAPPPAGWTDGNYLGGLLSVDGGRNWHPTRPLSGPLLQAVGGPVESAHDLITLYWADADTTDTTYVYSTWTDADDGIQGSQYFELGIVWAIEDSIFGPGYHGWDPGVAEYNDDLIHDAGLTILPSVTNVDCRVSFNVSLPGEVSLKVYDATGRLIEKAFTGYLDTGEHTVSLNTSTLANGVYLVAIESPSGTEVGKVVIQR
jgi:hypothetical protein